MNRGEIWFARLPEPVGSGPGMPHPVLIIQDDVFNRSRIRTRIIAVITSNVSLAQAPGNVFLPKNFSGLPQDSIVNVSQIITIDKLLLTDYISQIPPFLMKEVDDGLRLVFGL